MNLTITIQIANCGGPDVGPFDIYYDSAIPSHLLATQITCDQLINGYTLNSIPDTATNVLLYGTGTCTDIYTIPVIAVTPTPTLTPNIDCNFQFTIALVVTPTLTPSPTRTPVNSQTQTPTRTATPTNTPTITPTKTVTATNTITPTPTISVTPTNTPTKTVTPTRTATNTPTNTVTPTVTVTPTISITPTISNTPTPTVSVTNSTTPTVTPTNTPTPTNTITPTVTTTVTPTNSVTPTITKSPIPTRTQTPTPTITPSITPTMTPTITITPTISAPPPATIYYGVNSTGATPVESEIIAGISSTANPLVDVTADWSTLTSTPQYCWFAIKNLGSIDIKNYWYVNSINNGAIGGGSNLFKTRTQVTVLGEVFNVYVTNYKTQFVSSCLLKNTP